MQDQAIETEIQAKGLTAPRITPADIEANIASEHYFTAQEGVEGASKIAVGYDFKSDPAQHLELLTFCVLILRNGFTVTGESACASPENFDAELGRKIARANAVNKVWPLMGYALKERLFQGTPPILTELARATGGTIESVGSLPDGSGFATMSLPLPKDHWLTAPGYNEPPMGMKMGTDNPSREEMADKVRAAAKYAIRASTMNGKEIDFDPDAMCQNMVVGLLGYWTADGLSSL